MACIWDAVTTSLTKLVLDLGCPVRLHQDGDVLHESRISAAEMDALKKQEQLEELRLFSMYDSFQALVWETVYRNKSVGGIGVLDLKMAVTPITRSKKWRPASEVESLVRLNNTLKGKEYKYV